MLLPSKKYMVHFPKKVRTQIFICTNQIDLSYLVVDMIHQTSSITHNGYLHCCTNVDLYLLYSSHMICM